jgi:hypothetical protein
MSGSRDAKGTTPTVAKTEAEWSKLLTPREYAVLRKQYTEERNAGYTKCKDEGASLLRSRKLTPHANIAVCLVVSTHNFVVFWLCCL